MVTKGIITSIDFNGNTCQVRIPFFETAGNDQIINTAVISNTPGSYNGYKVGDVVLVAFEDGQMETPVVIGKLYLGVEKEKVDPRGVLNTEALNASKTATVPADTKLTTNTDKNLPNTMNPYANLSSIANNLNKLNTDVTYLDAFTNNQFRSVITNADGLRSSIEQNAEHIAVNASNISKQGEEIAGLDIRADELEANVLYKKEDGSQNGFGWNLTNESWKIKAYDKDPDDHLPEGGLDIFTIKRDTVEINAPNVKLTGQPKTSKTVYLSVPKDATDPTSSTTGWQDTIPASNADYNIWSATHTEYYTYTKNNNGSGSWNTRIEISNIKNLANLDAHEAAGTAQSTANAAQQTADNANNRITNDVNPAITALKQGKSTNYYGSENPATVWEDPNDHSKGYKYTIKEGDCWFNTGYYNKGKSNDAHDYLGNYVKEQNTYYLIADHKDTTQNPPLWTIDDITVGDTDIWIKDTLLQWDGNPSTDSSSGHWTDIGGELITNKLTANYINALDITAKKITVYKDGEVLFKANGISGEADSNTVEIASFKVGNDLTSTDDNQTGGPYIKYNTLGDTNSVLVSPGYKSKTAIGGSPAETEKEWAFTAGNAFGVTSNGDLYANNAHIKGDINVSGDLHTTNYNIGDDTGIWVSAAGINSEADVGGSGSGETRTWTIAAGDDFGVTTSGSVYANNAEISGKISASILKLTDVEMQIIDASKQHTYTIVPEIIKSEGEYLLNCFITNVFPDDIDPSVHATINVSFKVKLTGKSSLLDITKTTYISPEVTIANGQRGAYITLPKTFNIGFNYNVENAELIKADAKLITHGGGNFYNPGGFFVTKYSRYNETYLFTRNQLYTVKRDISFTNDHDWNDSAYWKEPVKNPPNISIYTDASSGLQFLVVPIPKIDFKTIYTATLTLNAADENTFLLTSINNDFVSVNFAYKSTINDSVLPSLNEQLSKNDKLSTDYHYLCFSLLGIGQRAKNTENTEAKNVFNFKPILGDTNTNGFIFTVQVTGTGSEEW